MRSLGGQGGSTWLVRRGSDRLVFRAAGGTYEVIVLEHLRAAGWPYRAPRLIPTASGRHFRIASDGRYWTLHPLIPGNPAPAAKPLAMVGEIGRMAASLDLALADVQLPAAEGDFRLKLFEPQQMPNLERLGHTALGRTCAEVLPPALNWLSSRRGDAVRALALLPWQTVYNDLHDNNILADGGRIVGLIDFDSLAEGPRVADLASALLYLLAEPSHRKLCYVQALGAGYGSIAPLGSTELELLPVLLVERLLATVENMLAERPLREHRRQMVHRFLDTLTWLLPRADCLADELATSGTVNPDHSNNRRR